MYVCMYVRMYVCMYMYVCINIYILAGGFNHVLFSIIYGIILPIDFHIFQGG